MDNTVEVQVQELGKVMATNRGEYISSKSYEILDIVSYNGSSFMSKIDDNTSVPAEEISPDELLINENWQLVAKKGDTYKVTEEDLQAIAKQITDNAKSAFNQNVETKIKEFNTNATNKVNDYDTNAKSTTETFDANAKKKLDEYNANDTKKLKAYNDNADSKLGAYNTNDTNKLKAYNTNADSKIEEYNTNANSKIAEYDEHSEELRNMAVSTDNELERVKNEILDTGSASDSFIHVEDSCMAKLKELEIEGVCEQETTKGVNLIKLSDGEFSSNGIIAKVNKGIITVNGTSTAQTYLVITKFIDRPTLSFEGNYTLSSNAIMNDISLSIYGDNNGSQLLMNSAQNTKTAVINGTYESVRMQLNIPSNKTYNNYILKPQLESGKSATSFEPYTGGQPSPSPDYPQEIRTITDSLKITSCGKNLLKNTATSAMINGVNFTVNDDGSVLVNGTATADAVFKIVPTAATFSQNLILSPNKTYVLSDSVGNYTDYFTQVVIQDANGKKSWYNTAGDIDISTNAIACLYTAQIYVRKDKTLNNVLFKPQFVVKDSANLFEPYVESLITANLPENEFIGKLDDTYKDTLRAEYSPEEGQYHLMLDKKVGKYVFTGNENIVLFSSERDIKQYYYALNTCLSVTNRQLNNIYVMSNYFQGVEWQKSWTKNNTITIGWGKRLFIDSKDFTSIDNLKNFLSTNAVEVYYPLETPYTLELCVIDMPLSYKKITNILTDSDLLSTINAKYYRTFQTTVQNLQINEKSLKQEITDLNNSISDITKRLEALESANATTVEESEVSNDLQN